MDVKKEFKKRMTLRASSMLYSLDEFLRTQHGGTDPVFSRLRYLAFSYASELTVKACCLEDITVSESSVLNETLQKLGHDLSKIYDKHSAALSKYDIKTIKVSKPDLRQYKVTTSKGSFFVEDFVVVRYDFVENQLRVSTHDEVERMKLESGFLRKIINQLKAEI